jgi:DNA modification methylase
LKNKQPDKSIGIRNKSLADREIIAKLKSLGKLDVQFKDEDILVSLIHHENKDIRYYSINNLAKIKNIKLLEIYILALRKEKTSRNRREIASAIGRMRHEKAIPTLKKLLKDNDPNVVLQSVRGLLVFKDRKPILNLLKKLKDHPNELVKKVIGIEFPEKTKDLKDHSKVDEMLKNLVINGDTLKIMKKIKKDSLHLTFTSPPYYNARDYSIYDSYESYLKFLTKVFKEVYRITKEGRFFVLNTSPIIIPRVGRKYSSKRYPIPYDLHYLLIKMGWEFIDDIIWVKPEPSAKNRVSGFNQHRKPLAYKPNCVSESIMVYRKQSDKLIDWNLKQYSDEIIQESKVEDGFETSNVWHIDPTFDKTHSAVFPKELCDRVIKYYSLKGDLVFDPFAGSGSVGLSALDNDRYFLLTELDKTYFNLMKKKLGNDLFSENVTFVKEDQF